MNSDLSYDQLISNFIDSKVAGDAALFNQAMIAYVLKEHLGATAKQVASDVAYSARYVNILVKTYSAFPTEDSRAVDLSFSHHQIAAHTEQPEYWLNLAVENGWSVRELAREIRGLKESDEVLEAEKLWNKIELILLAAGQGARLLLENFKGWLADHDGTEASETSQETEEQAEEYIQEVSAS